MINIQGKAVNLRNTDHKGGGVKPYGQPDKISDFSLDDFPQGRCRNIYFWRNMHPWCRGNWVVQGKSYNGPKQNSLGLLGASIVHKYGANQVNSTFHIFDNLLDFARCKSYA